MPISGGYEYSYFVFVTRSYTYLFVSCLGSFPTGRETFLT